MGITVLQGELENVYLAPFVSPSHLAAVNACVMRTFGRHERGHGFLPMLISGPATEIGNLIHRAIEIADGRTNLIEVFDLLRAGKEFELEQDQRRRHYANLSITVGELSWAEKISILKSHSGDLPELDLANWPVTMSAIKSLNEFNPIKLNWPSVNYEVPFRSDSLAMSGRIDKVELKFPNIAIITDFKTGAIMDCNSEIKFKYKIQLAAYELLVREVWPDVKVSLFLDNGEQFEVELTSEDRQELAKRLKNLKESISDKLKSVVASESVQTVGAGCLQCPMRHVCKTYKKILEKDSFHLNFEESDYQNISDGFGRAVSKKSLMGHHIVNIKTSSDRMVQLRSKHNWQVSEIEVGEYIYFFNFAQKQNRNQMTLSKGLPSNFSDEFFSGRNWSAEVFKKYDQV